MIRARRWSTSVPVMMRPLTMAVALRTLGSLLPKMVTSLGRLSCCEATPSSSPTVWAATAFTPVARRAEDRSMVRKPDRTWLPMRENGETTGCTCDHNHQSVRHEMRHTPLHDPEQEPARLIHKRH